MNIDITNLISKSSRSFKSPILLCLIFSVAGSACGPDREPATSTPEPTSTPVPVPTISSGGPCEVAVGKTLPLAVTGVPGTGVVYRWTATVGNINPPEGPAVTYIAPDEPQNVIIRVEAEKDGVTSDATINCKVIGPTPTPANTETPAPTITPIPSPTQWACTSYRSEKIQDADISGTVTINTPLQATVDLPSGKNVQVAGKYIGLPAGKYVWVFIYSAQAGLHGRYYPQTRGADEGWQPDPTTGGDGSWSLNVNFGAPNLCYEVVVMVADAEASQSIAEQLQKWAAAKDYTGYELNGPPSAEPPDPPGFPNGLVEKASIEVKTR